MVAPVSPTRTSATAAVANPKMMKSAKEFESVFLEQSFGHMFAGLSGEGPLGTNGAGGDTWRGMLVQEYARSVSKAGGVGIADAVYRELVRLQESKAHG